MVAATAILSVVAVRIVDSARSEDRVAPVAATAPMIGHDGVRVGHVEVVDAGTSASLAITVDYALPDGSYRVALAPRNAMREVVGTMTVAAGRGVWAGAASLGDGPTDLQLLDADGRVPCSARLPAS